MESNKQDTAASSNPADDLDATLEALRLSDSSSTSEPLLRPLQAPQQELTPTASPDEQLTRELQILQMLGLCEGDENAGYVDSPGGSSITNNVEHDMRFATLGSPFPPYIPIEYQPWAIASYPHRMATANLFAAAWPWRHYSLFNPYAPHLARGVAQDALREFRANLLGTQERDQETLDLLSRSSEKVVQLLNARDEEVLSFVVNKVNHRVYDVMTRSEMHTVFFALLRVLKCDKRIDKLTSIALAAESSSISLMVAAENHYCETALKELISAVAPYSELCQQLINCLLNINLMRQNKGPALLRHFFATLTSEDSAIIIDFAIRNFQSMCSCPAGAMCLEICFMEARYKELNHGSATELNDLERAIWSSASEVAKGKYSTIFLQRICVISSEQFKKCIREHIVANLVDLCVHERGNYVVQVYFLREPSRGMLELLFPVFLALRDHELAELVRGNHSNFVVRSLLRNSHHECWELTKALAMRIERLPAYVLEQELEFTMKVMHVVKTVLRSNQQQH